MFGSTKERYNVPKSHWLIGGQMKRIAKFVLLAGALSITFLLGQNSSNFDKWWTPENDALAAAPQHHKLLFENDEVRVLEVSVPPGVREPLHATVTPVFSITSQPLI